jgi:hypothetical protein
MRFGSQVIQVPARRVAWQPSLSMPSFALVACRVGWWKCPWRGSTLLLSYIWLVALRLDVLIGWAVHVDGMMPWAPQEDFYR